MFVQLLLILTIVPFVELAILLRLADAFSWSATLALVIVTGIVGAWLARREGLRALATLQSEMAAGHAPADAIVDALLIFVAGVVLVTPGVLTDLCGFCLLVPAIRAVVKRRLQRFFSNRMVTMRYDVDMTHDHVRDDTFVDVEGDGRDVNDSTTSLP